MGKSNEEIMETAYLQGEKYEQQCTGCAQTCIAGIFDAIGIYNEDVFKAASGLADGLGLSRDGSCGALVGGSMVIGYLFGRERKDFKDMYAPMRSYLMVKELHDKYVERFGTCRCYDVQMSLMGRTYDLLDEKEFDEAMKEGMLTHCSQVVGTAAKMATGLILDAWEQDKAS